VALPKRGKQSEDRPADWQAVTSVGEKRYYHWAGRNFSSEIFGSQLVSLIREVRERTGKTKVIYLCIGSDRSTGDSLGPLVGHQLCRALPEASMLSSLFCLNASQPLVLGTLKEPVHAINLKKTMELIRRFHRNALVVAVDASVGSERNVGGITLGVGSIRPGMGVQKKLGEVGDIYITGVVHGGERLEPETLQSTRLSLVMELAECISAGIVETFCGEGALV